jgi:hypothetical protein
MCVARTLSQIHERDVLLQSKLVLLQQTKMVDETKTCYEELYPGKPLPTSIAEEKAACLAQLKALSDGCRPLLEVIEGAEVTELREGKNFTPEFLKQFYQVRPGRIGSWCMFVCVCMDVCLCIRSIYRYAFAPARLYLPQTGYGGPHRCLVHFGSLQI